MLASILLSAAVSGPVAIHSGSAGVAVRHDPLGGLPLCVWNDSSLFRSLRPGVLEQDQHIFRYPNGSTSDEYHWNGSGIFDADSQWVSSDSTYSPGWVGETIHRGTTRNTTGYIRPSLIDDGDTNTFWWSDTDHPDAPGWFYLDLGSAEPIDSLALWLGSIRPDSVQILVWTRDQGAIYPGPHQQPAGWTEIARHTASSLVGLKTQTSTVRYVAVRPIGIPADGWQVREFQLFLRGSTVSVNIPDGANQSKVTAISVLPGVRPRSYASDWDFQTFMTWIGAYPRAQPVICVNYGGGTPQEAAAWVHYANLVEHYGIRRWQIGNEMANDGEDGGPVSARQYAERFVRFARAMKAEDSSIAISGPVFGSDQFTQNASGDFDGKSWMEGFLSYLDSVERHDGTRLVDGIDFHDYPYWFASSPDPTAMFAACDGVGASFDSLVSLMGRTIADPSSREVVMSEYNASTQAGSYLQEASGGAAAGLELAHFIQRFGDRGVAVFWELFEEGGVGPDGTFGALTAFDKPTQGEWSSLAHPPGAAFWATRTILREWLDTAGGDTVMPIDQVPGVRMFAVRNAGRISILGFDLGPDSAMVALDPAMLSAGDILSWGTGEYRWMGSGSDARAVPDNGPSSRPIPPGWDGTLKIPPYGIAVVRAVGHSAERPRTGHFLVDRSQPTVSDTVTAAGWTVAEGSHLSGGIWSAGGASGKLVATDGAWDGPAESWTARIPASALGEGTRTVRFLVATAAGDTARDSLDLQVSGSLRPVLLVSDFDNGRATTTWGDTWTGLTGQTDSVAFAQSVDTVGGLGSPYLDLSMHIGQPAALGYPNFGSTVFPVPANLVADTSRNLVGLVFDIKTAHSSSAGDFHLIAINTAVVDHNDHFAVLPTTGGIWVHDTALFANFSQGSWAVNVGPLNPALITGMEFRCEGAGDATLALDNVEFLGTKGANYLAAIRSRSAKSAMMEVVGGRLQVGIQGDWTLRLIGPDGRTQAYWSSRGPALIQPPRIHGVVWALLGAAGRRYSLALPPVVP